MCVGSGALSSFAVMNMTSSRGADQAATGREHIRPAGIVQALLSVPLHSFVIYLTHKLPLVQVAYTLAIIASQLKQSVVNSHDSVCIWY